MSGIKTSIAAAAVVCIALIMSVVACGGGHTVDLFADEQRTLQIAEEQGFKLCHVLDEHICESTDSVLVFHMPRQLEFDTVRLVLSDAILISNQGYDVIRLESYSLTLIDDRSITYRPEFSGPGGYDQTSPFTPALVLQPNDRVEITFNQHLRSGSRAVRSMTITYLREGRTVERKVVISYRPRSLEAVNQTRS